MTGMKINYDAIAEFLTLGFVLRDHTFRLGEKAENIIEIPSFEIKRISTFTDAIRIDVEKKRCKQINNEILFSIHLH